LKYDAFFAIAAPSACQTWSAAFQAAVPPASSRLEPHGAGRMPA